MTVVEYVWLDGKGIIRSKKRTIGKKYLIDFNNQSFHQHLFVDLNRTDSGKELAQTMEWTYDGSSTGDAHGNNSEVIIRPIYITPNPFKQKRSKYSPGNSGDFIYLCECLNYMGEPLPSNIYRKYIVENLKEEKDRKPMFGFEQEFFLLQQNKDYPTKCSNIPLGSVEGHLKYVSQESQQYYCGNGNFVSQGRNIVDSLYNCCLENGYTLSGTNAEVAPGQWEIQIGPLYGIEACHQLILVRFLLIRVAESQNVDVSFVPKLYENINGSGLHTNYSDSQMRKNEETTREYIEDFCASLSETHEETMKVYGEGNERRMTGHHETASYRFFSWGVADRSSSIRIPRQVDTKGYGYIEDRRPAANANPYYIYRVLTEYSFDNIEQCEEKVVNCYSIKSVQNPNLYLS